MSGVLELSSVVFVFIHVIISPEWLFDNECLCLSKALYTICVVKYLWRQNGIRLIIVFVWIQNKSHFKTLQCIYKMYTYFWCSQNIVHAYAFYLHTNLQHLKKSSTHFRCFAMFYIVIKEMQLKQCLSRTVAL